MPSGPIKLQDFTTQQYRDAGLAEPGVVGDVDGSAYQVHVPASVTSRTLTLGSDTQRSVLHVGGLFVHHIPVGGRETVIPDVPEFASATRVMIVARFDPAQEARNPQGPIDLRLLMGPVGQPGTLPSHDNDETGITELPLWTGVIEPGKPLTDVLWDWVGNHLGPSMFIPDGLGLPSNVPIGTIARWQGETYHRVLGQEAGSVWRSDTPATRRWTIDRLRRTTVQGIPIDSILQANTPLILFGSPITVPTGQYRVDVHFTLAPRDGGTVPGNITVQSSRGGARVVPIRVNGGPDAYRVSVPFTVDGPAYTQEVIFTASVQSDGGIIDVHNRWCFMDIYYLGTDTAGPVNLSV